MATSLDDKRPDWDETFLEMTQTLTKRSTCVRIQTAAILVRDSRVISIGYNGVSSGSQHCVDYWKEYHLSCQADKYSTFADFLQSETFLELHHAWATKNELHGVITTARGDLNDKISTITVDLNEKIIISRSAKIRCTTCINSHV